MEVDAQALSSQLLRGLRGKRTQSGMSRALGYGYNQYAKWERGFKRVYWADLSRICELKRLPLASWIEELYDFPESRKAIPGKILLRELGRAHFADDATALGRRLGARPSTVRRWLSGETDLPLEAAIRGLSYRPRAFQLLMARLGAGQGTVVPERSLAGLPFASAVQHFVSTREYRSGRRHDAGLVSRKLRLSRDQVARAVEHLLSAGLIEPDQARYRASCDPEELKGVSQEELALLMRYWMYRALCSTEARVAGKGSSEVKNARAFKVFSVSARTANEISRRLREAYVGILELIEKDTDPAEVVRAIVLHHFDAADCPHIDFVSDPELGLRLKSGP